MICPLCTAGVQRFKMTKVVQERPILIAEVELLPEEEDISQEVLHFFATIRILTHLDLYLGMGCLTSQCLCIIFTSYRFCALVHA